MLSNSEHSWNNILKLRGLFFRTGLIISISMCLWAFNWRFHEQMTDKPDRDTFYVSNDIEIIPATEHKKEVEIRHEDPKVTKPKITEKDPPEQADKKKEPQKKPDFRNDDVILPELPDEPVNPYEPYQVSREPDYPGGKNAFVACVLSNFEYPKEAVKLDIQGRVYVEFVVDKEGKVKNIKMLKGLGLSSIDLELERVLKICDGWIPGSQNGISVPVKQRVGVRLRLKD